MRSKQKINSAWIIVFKELEKCPTISMIFGADVRTDKPELLNMVELDMDEYLSIANELKNYVDHGYDECFR